VNRNQYWLVHFINSRNTGITFSIYSFFTNYSKYLFIQVEQKRIERDVLLKTLEQLRVFWVSVLESNHMPTSSDF
jgi:hypothetical protein